MCGGLGSHRQAQEVAGSHDPTRFDQFPAEDYRARTPVPEPGTGDYALVHNAGP